MGPLRTAGVLSYVRYGLFQNRPEGKLPARGSTYFVLAADPRLSWEKGTVEVLGVMLAVYLVKQSRLEDRGQGEEQMRSASDDGQTFQQWTAGLAMMLDVPRVWVMAPVTVAFLVLQILVACVGR